MRAHDCPVVSISRDGNSGVITGGKDGSVIVWSNDLKKLSELSVLDVCTPPPLHTSIHSVSTDQFGSKFLVACKSGELYVFTIESFHTRSIQPIFVRSLSHDMHLLSIHIAVMRL